MTETIKRLKAKVRAAELWPHGIDEDEADDIEVCRLAAELIESLQSKLHLSESAGAALGSRVIDLENRLDKLESALRRIVDGRFLGYVEAQEIAGQALGVEKLNHETHEG